MVFILTQLLGDCQKARLSISVANRSMLTQTKEVLAVEGSSRLDKKRYAHS